MMFISPTLNELPSLIWGYIATIPSPCCPPLLGCSPCGGLCSVVLARRFASRLCMAGFTKEQPRPRLRAERGKVVYGGIQSGSFSIRHPPSPPKAPPTFPTEYDPTSP